MVVLFACLLYYMSLVQSCTICKVKMMIMVIIMITNRPVMCCCLVAQMLIQSEVVFLPV